MAEEEEILTMAHYRMNEYGQPVGQSMPDWKPRDMPSVKEFQGQYCRLEYLDIAKHGDDLFREYEKTGESNWTYLPYGPFRDRKDFDDYLSGQVGRQDPFHYAIIDQISGRALGSFALLRIDRMNGGLELGHVVFYKTMKQTRIATEAQFLLLSYVFGNLKYRRCEWRCDAHNAPSRAAALRLGFQFEALFRNAAVFRNRQRDTAWFSIICEDWPEIKNAFISWLVPDNFDEEAQQIRKLSEFR